MLDFYGSQNEDPTWLFILALTSVTLVSYAVQSREEVSFYPIPVADDVWPQLTEAKIFSLCDAMDGFPAGEFDRTQRPADNILDTIWQIHMEKNAIWIPDEFQSRFTYSLEDLNMVLS